MHWLGQSCALHARLSEGLLQVAARSSALRGARGVSSGGRFQAAAVRPSGVGVWLLSGQVQPNLVTAQAPRRAHQQRARVWQGRGQRLHHLFRGSLLPRAVSFLLPTTGTSFVRLPEPRCREDELLLLLLPPKQPDKGAADAHQLLSKITLQATGSGLTPGGGGGGGGGSSSSSSVRSQKDVGGAPENEHADHSKENGKKPNKSQQLKKVFKEYGAVGVGFHVGISLISLGMFYLAVSSGVDIAAILFKLGFDEALVQSKLAAGTSAFVLAYAIHKLFAPVRISITLVSVPFLVRYFRKIGFFKPPAPNP